MPVTRKVPPTEETGAAVHLARSRVDGSTGADSARQLLLTVLGELVLPAGGTAWTSSVVGVFSMLGVEEKAARQVLARAAARGWLVAERAGRRTRWRIAPELVAVLERGAERIYSFGRTRRRWDGTWLLVTATEEMSREARHRLRIGLSWAGFGSLTPGVWISPWTDRGAEVRSLVEAVGAGGVVSFVSELGGLGDPQAIVRRAWDLSHIRDAYDAFLRGPAAATPTSPADVVAAQCRLVHEWRRFPFVDPALPGELLETAWPGTAAASAFHARRTAWWRTSARWWAEVERAAGA